MNVICKKSIPCVLLLVQLLCGAGNAAAQSATAEDFYRGNTVTIMLGSPAGSLTDLLARQFANSFSKHIPGQPDVIVSNMPGAGGMITAARLQMDAPKDGTAIGILQRNNLYRSFVDGDERGFDPREVDWIGSLDKVAFAMAVTNRSPVRNAGDMFSTRTIIAATGVGNDDRTLPELMNKYMGTQFRIIYGYDGRAEVYLAMERGEVDGWASTISGLMQPDQAAMVEQGTFTPIVHMAWESHPAFPDLPNFSDYVDDPEVRKVIDFFLAPMESGRPVGLPKGVPQDRLAALTAAFEATVEDPEFIANLQRLNWSIEPVSGPEVQAVIDQIYQTSDATLEAVREILAPPRR